MPKQIPVYLFVGQLESGKTKFIQETMEDPNFDSGDKTLLLVCEEGEIEYDPKKFAFGGVHVAQIEDKSELTQENLTALENVELALEICKDPLDAREVLSEVGLAERADNFPARLSGGEQQRVSIARALAKNPKLLLCDEPTGALDYQTGKAILKLLQDTCREKGMTVVVITHNSAIAPMADRVIEIKNGKCVRQRMNEHPMPVEKIEW